MSGRPFSKIVCCVDRGDASRVVERRAKELAEVAGGDLRLLHVMRPPRAFTGGVTSRSLPPEVLEGRLREEAMAWMQKHGEPESNIEISLLEASFAGEAICDWATKHPVTVLVAGRNEKHHFWDLGSTATYLSGHAPCDLLLVDATADGTGAP